MQEVGMVERQLSLRCRRCSGRMVPGLDGHSCLVCGHVDYGPDFKPLKLTVAEAKRLESETEHNRGPRSAYRRNDHSDDLAPAKGRGYLYRAPAIE